MSERFKEPVLKTGDAQASVGSNPTLSAIFQTGLAVIRPMRKYPSGRRGSPAKGVDVQTTCEGSNPSFRASSEKALKAMEKAFRAFSIRRTGFFFAFKHDPQFVRPDDERSWRRSRQHLLGSCLRYGGAGRERVPLLWEEGAFCGLSIVRKRNGAWVAQRQTAVGLEPGEGTLPLDETERGRLSAGGRFYGHVRYGVSRRLYLQGLPEGSRRILRNYHSHRRTQTNGL